MAPPIPDRGTEVDHIAGRNALPPNVRYELQTFIDDLHAKTRAQGFELTNLQALRQSETGTLRLNLTNTSRANATLKNDLLAAKHENTALKDSLRNREREITTLREKLNGDGLLDLYQAGTKFIKEQGKQIKELRAELLKLKEDGERRSINFEMRAKEKDAIIAECQDVQFIATLKVQNAELASSANAHKMLNDELNKKIAVVRKHYDERKVLMEDQEKLIKRYQKQFADTEKKLGA